MTNLLLAAAAIFAVSLCVVGVVALAIAIGMTLIARELFRAREED